MANIPEEEYTERIMNLPLEKQVAIFVEGTRSLHGFATQKICPIVITQLGRSRHEDAVSATYGRMCLVVEALAKLGESRHFQMAAMATRSLFELLLDLKILANDPGAADKFFDFVDIDKFRKAERLRDFLAAHQSIDPQPHHAALAFANDTARRQRLEQLCVGHWGATPKGKPKWPEHWSGVNKIKDRAAMAGPEYEEFYRAEYWFQSCYVHAGATGILNLDRETFEKYFAIVHNMAQRLFVEATRIVSSVYPLFQMEPGLRQEVEKAPTFGKVWAVMKLLEEGGARSGNGGIP